MTGILAIQFNPKIGDKKENLKTVEKFLEKNSDEKLDLVVMPEFFSTGISDKAFIELAEDENGRETIKFLSELAKKYNTNIICGTVIEKSADKYYNTSFALNRSGEIIAKYRKIHLFNFMGGNEGDIITAGNEEVIADMDFGKVGMAICFDIRYPQLMRKLVQKGAEIIVLPTAWVMPSEIYDDKNLRNYADEMWLAMNRTRAYDNLCYMVTCDQTGHVDDKKATLGTSLIISPSAQILANACYEETAIYYNIDLEIVRLLKTQYPIASID